MCGIAGIIRLSDSASPVAAEELVRMQATMRHRGPNAAGEVICDDVCGFAHRRLSIIDLDAESNQPFESDDGQVVLVYNGELFNFVELRTELEGLGHRFRTASDTEVLLASYLEWGNQCVTRFNGMWAFAIYDSRDRSVFCSRDRFGIKPFIFGEHAGRLYFASEAKAILAVEDAFRRPNFDSLSLLLRSSITGYNPETCFKGLHRLKPAHNLSIRNGVVSESRYWDYPSLADVPPGYEEACSEFRRLLADSIRIRLRSDVPLGLTLSGGLDSSAIACHTRQLSAVCLNTYTASYAGHAEWDESARASSLARELTYQSHCVALERKEFLTNARAAVRHLETPHHSIAILPYWNIMRRASEDVSVLLEGQGADELLGGYVSITSLSALQDDMKRLRVSEAIKRLRTGMSGQLGFTGKRFFMELTRSCIPGLHDVLRHWRGDERVYIRELVNGPARLRERRFPADYQDTINRSLILQHERGLRNLLLYGDAISMAFSIESRLPFMDYRLVEFCFSLPGTYKLRSGLGKAILRDSSRGLVPDDILNDRRKLGFVAPVAEWLREDRGIADDILNSKACRERGLFNTKQIRHMISQHASGRINVFSNIYRWMLTEMWFQEFIDRKPDVVTAS